MLVTRQDFLCKIEYRKENKRLRSRHLFSPDILTMKRSFRVYGTKFRREGTTMKYSGHRIKEVLPGSIAQELEIEPGDRLLAINDHEIEDIFDFQFLLSHFVLWHIPLVIFQN